MRAAHERDVRRGGAQRRADVHLDAHLVEQVGDLRDVVAVAEAEGRAAEDVAGDALGALHRHRQGADDAVEGLVGPEVLLALIAGQFESYDRHRQAHRLGQPAGIVLDQLGGAGRADDERLRLEPVVGILAGGAEQPGGVGAQIAGLEGGVGDGRAMVAPLDHGEEQVGIGVALRRVEDVVQALHGGGDAHRADVGRALVCPDGELHAGTGRGAAPDPGIFAERGRSRIARRLSERAKSAARSPACS